jgi:hypothetical protein
MENYKVEQLTDDLVVWDGHQREFIKVKRRFNWSVSVPKVRRL